MRKSLLFVLLIVLAATAAIGTYRIRKHFAATASVAGENPVVAVKPPSLSLSITCRPEAMVYLNGDYRGLTPIKIDGLSAARYALRLTREGFIPHQEAVALEESKTLAISLKARPKCRLEVNSNPDGALVFLDGIQRGRTPYVFTGLEAGEHYLKLVKTNYFPATRNLVLAEDQPEEASFDLKNRFVEAYQAALKANPYNLAAYNDLGQELYVLGRYQEAAEVYVRGYIAASPPFKGKLTGHDSTDRQRLLKEARRRSKHPEPEFQEALNQAVFAAMRKGIKASCLLDDFKKLPRGRYPQEAVRAMDLLLEKHPDDLDLIISLIPYYYELNANRQILKLFDVVMNSAATDFNKQMKFAELILHILDKHKNHLLQRKFEAYLARIEPLERSGQENAYFTYLTGRLAFIKDNPSAGRKLWQEAIATQSNPEIAARWRLALAEYYQEKENFASAAKIIYTILESSNPNSPVYRKAWKMERMLPSKYRKHK